jgi:hypothetical protein
MYAIVVAADMASAWRSEFNNRKLIGNISDTTRIVGIPYLLPCNINLRETKFVEPKEKLCASAQVYEYENLTPRIGPGRDLRRLAMLSQLRVARHIR